MIVRPKKHKKRKKNKAHKIDEPVKNYITMINGVEIYSWPQIKASHSEKIIREYLRKNNIEYIREVGLGSSPYRYDFLLPKYNFIIEYDGQEFHSKQKDVDRDNRKDKLATSKGFKVFRLNKKNWNNLGEAVENIIFSHVLEKRESC